MLVICELLLRQNMPLEEAGSKYLPSINREDLILYDIFERFVACFYGVHLKENWEITRQAKLKWNNKKTSEYLPSMKVDLKLKHRHTGQTFILDTKFTEIIKPTEYGIKFISEHIYQIYAYLRSHEQFSNDNEPAVGVLLYPTVKYDLDETVKLHGHQINFRTINLTLTWEEIERRLLRLFSCP